ncbi:type II secretion system protein [Metabacillus iocasae]|uniref:General secretion pathway protein G n=1 Tax=Priestia iocasae TaxID=2291674 RepID=A0ABS2QPJ4_9BACI|nr:type II secretion system protein [Metabacillus iocasae]MBM7701361.1 general secretion pathway protein G [Metabacillus iocasae]
MLNAAKGIYRRLIGNKSGLTLIELLAVLAILGIVALIAVLAFMPIIEKSKDQAFVANAIAMKEAATFHKRTSEVALNPSVKARLTYEDLIEDGYLPALIDPHTNEEWSVQTDNQQSFVEMQFIDSSIHYYVCLKGAKKQLCAEDGKGILSTELSTDFVKDLVKK